MSAPRRSLARSLNRSSPSHRRKPSVQASRSSIKKVAANTRSADAGLRHLLAAGNSV